MYSRHRSQELASSSISRLPVELLSEIFTLCTLAATETDAEDTEYSSNLINPDGLAMTLLLSSVNRRWREVILNQANLWSNICVTAELLSSPDDLGIFSAESGSSPQLNAKQIVSCLERSRQHPLNILIDARDENWNFIESDVGTDYGDAPIRIPFSSEHIITVVSLLLPHISRWKSLTILTDTWAPMHAALTTINPYITEFGAPLLESMTLMRCNDFVSFSPQFQPLHLKEPAFLCRGSVGPLGPSKAILPRLKHLSFRGVHADWDSLSDALSASPSSLKCLELQSHCADVRPTVDQFHRLLNSTPALRRLVISGSGAELPDDVDDMAHDYLPVHLPELQDITIGYRTAFEGRLAVKLLDAPNTKSLTLEDATYPGDPEEVNGTSILTYLGSKESHTNDMDFDMHEAVRDSGRNNHPFQCPHSARRKTFNKEEPRAAFPLLRSVTLKNIKAPPAPMRTFFSALSHLERLELTGMPMQAVHALLPCAGPSIAVSSCPCPQLRSLCIKGSEQLKTQDLDYIVGGLATERQNNGACGLQEVDIHLDAARAASVFAAASPGTKVNIISDSEDEDDVMDFMDQDQEMNAFKPGGIFNDPVFDAYYSVQIVSR
ncbi:hypothetical protein BDZ97DRAFT_1665313 [Flammula alnicola]|nr:hypothetical protein BDZ97DRAFT_1665313 [Flammula alnicola]